MLLRKQHLRAGVPHFQTSTFWSSAKVSANWPLEPIRLVALISPAESRGPSELVMGHGGLFLFRFRWNVNPIHPYTKHQQQTATNKSEGSELGKRRINMTYRKHINYIDTKPWYDPRLCIYRSERKLQMARCGWDIASGWTIWDAGTLGWVFGAPSILKNIAGIMSYPYSTHTYICIYTYK